MKLGHLDENGGTETWHLDLRWHYGATGLNNSETVPLLNFLYYLKYKVPIFSASFESGVLVIWTWKLIHLLLSQLIHLLLSHTAMTCMLSHVQLFVTPRKKGEYRIWAWVPQSCINYLFNLTVHSLVPLSQNTEFPGILLGTRIQRLTLTNLTLSANGGNGCETQGVHKLTWEWEASCLIWC